MRVRYTAPRPLRAVWPSGDTIVVDRVREFTGRVEAARGDTLDVWVRSVNGAPPPAAGARVRLVPGAGERVEAERISVGRTLGLTLLLAPLAAGTALAILVSQLGNY